MYFSKTKNLLEITINDTVNHSYSITRYYTFTTSRHIDANFYHIIERKYYYVQGLYSGDIIRYYKDGKTIEYVNTVTGETKLLTDRTFRIIENEE
jgi:hypothetical protein